VSEKRALPGQPSLRYLKLEAKQRRAAGEFATLHDAQLALAREHGQPSWAALREAVTAAAGSGGHALAHLAWIAARFGSAGEPGWAAPGEDELREHFTAEYLTRTPPGRLIAAITQVGPDLHANLVVSGATRFSVYARLGGRLVTAATEPRPPYRLASITQRPLGERISDPRTAAPPAAAAGPVPGEVPALAAGAVAGLGLAGLTLAGASAGEQPWTAAAGWASLERAEPLHADHVFPAWQVTTVVTAVTVLCRAAGGRLRLDDRANAYLTAVRLADDTVTIRDLLTYTAGVTDPREPFAPAAPPLAAVTGPVIACTGKRGIFGYGQAGYAALGEIIAERTGLAYSEAATRLVLRPLGLQQSRFPATGRADPLPGSPPAAGYPAVTCYDVAADGTFTPLDGLVCVFPAAGGLWTTAADLVRFGLGWASLLPRSLVAQAIRPHAQQPNGAHVGLGWGVNVPAGALGLVGNGPGAAASLLVSADGAHACAALANRQLLMEPVNAEVYQLLGGRNIRLD